MQTKTLTLITITTLITMTIITIAILLTTKPTILSLFYSVRVFLTVNFIILAIWTLSDQTKLDPPPQTPPKPQPNNPPPQPEVEQASMDETWEAIVGSKKELRRCETTVKEPKKVVRKVETFHEGRRKRAPVVRREVEVVVVGDDELNRRFDGFIEKVRAQLRLQRQESYQRFVDLIRGGA